MFYNQTESVLLLYFLFTDKHNESTEPSNGESVGAATSRDGGRIVNLVGYRSESDGEDEPQQSNALDSKVNDFLKVSMCVSQN